ncbi:DUF3644 domain-containing protein [Streptomyces sp. NRRL F-5126]|uniref:DUF3644 domain-containing protein n=1 Tax=Streptomyces sp. NRRL F-5126 TaxID=1463857 RepID=UPI000AFD9984|nr:DUF3644 domain-containing protein [Streptomyces sp. NRRL F-5126]
MLNESERHALKAVDEWNCSTGNFSDFLTHMHKAWLYLLHAEFKKDGVDFNYKDRQTGQYKMIDGEPSAWDLEQCLKKRYPDSTDAAVRRNAELFVALRNKVEHRYEHNLKIVTGGKAQALVMNYEQERVAHFGLDYSLAHLLRFPITLQSLTTEGQAQQREAAAKLPKGTRDLVTRFEAGMDQAVKDDLRYDYRVRLVPIVGNKTDADLAVEFVNYNDLTDEEREVMMEAGRTGTVVTKMKHIEVTNKAKLRATTVAERVEARLPFYFSAYGEHTEMWRRFNVRPAKDATDPCLTDARYCIYDEPVKTYLYTDAWVEKVIKEIGTVEKYRNFFGKKPRMKNVATLLQQAASDESAISKSA